MLLRKNPGKVFSGQKYEEYDCSIRFSKKLGDFLLRIGKQTLFFW